MRRILHIALAAASMTALAAPAHAGGGDFAAGVFGGLAAGAIIGSAQRPYYDPPPPPPAYYYDGPRYDGPCHWERGRRYWDDYEGVYRWSRVRVCD